MGQQPEKMVLQPPSTWVEFKCLPAIVAVRAAIARTTLAKNLRAQPLPAKILEMGLLGMAANVPLCSWREHTSMFLKECLASGTYQFHSQQCSGRESHLDAKISHGLYYSRIRPGPGGSRAELYRLSAVAER
ncbi:hypothetical protein SAY87_025934 [Trapa incisa]|uniref:Uncharacterized protein n=1 Tax=Trapa incisa TaxID=236973 RepID=A0AAN7GUN0_9MYRT|nr:hypothetical protein SAY87_025934 [Trapa incisa]